MGSTVILMGVIIILVVIYTIILIKMRSRAKKQYEDLTKEKEKLSILLNDKKKSIALLNEENIELNKKFREKTESFKEIINEKETEINKWVERVTNLLDAEDGFVAFTKMLADFKGETRFTKSFEQLELKSTLYKYEYLLSIFPNLSQYVDNYNPFTDKEFKKKIRPNACGNRKKSIYLQKDF